MNLCIYELKKANYNINLVYMKNTEMNLENIKL